MSHPRAIYRGFALIFLTLWYLTPILVRAGIRGTDLSHALRIRQRWALAVTRLLGLKIQEEGLPVPEGTCLYVSNHRSYMDPIVALRQIRALPVAKAEVSGWPLVGFAARSTGILYVKRESRRSRSNTLQAMNEALNEGKSILIYPEGTTHLEPTTTTFRKGAFRLATDEQIPVVPMAIEYGRKEDAWVGDATFLPHFLSTFGRRRTEVRIRYGQAVMHPEYPVLLKETREWIDAAMQDFSAK